MINDCVFCSTNGDNPLYVHEKWRVLSVNDPDYPGFCRVVWHHHVAEMTDLSEEDRTELMRVVWLVEQCIRQVMQPNKINLASLGNQVPHIHWHIIPRYTDDRHFPDSIWATVKREQNESKIRKRMEKTAELRKKLLDILNKQYGPSQPLSYPCPN